jgi:hypothetical protein
MQEYEFDLSTVDTVTVQANDGDEATHDFLNKIEDKVKRGTIPVEFEKTFRVRAKATGCTYHVAGVNRAEASDALRTYISERKDELLDEQSYGTERAFINDLSTEVDVEDEVDVTPEINSDGERIT